MENRGPIIIRNGPKLNVTGNELKCSYDTFISGLLLVIVKEQSFSNLYSSSSSAFAPKNFPRTDFF